MSRVETLSRGRCFFESCTKLYVVPVCLMRRSTIDFDSVRRQAVSSVVAHNEFYLRGGRNVALMMNCNRSIISRWCAVGRSSRR